MRRTLAAALTLLLAAAAAEAQQPRVAEVQIAPRYVRLRVAAQAPLVATAYDADGVPLDVTFQWASSNINVVEVQADGTVRGLAPGIAVVTASAGSGNLRRIGQVTVYVMRPERVWVTPVPPTPGAPPSGAVPPTTGAPQAPMTPPPGVWVVPVEPSRGYVDSVIRASIDCTDPFINAINPARACYDERARLLDPARLMLSVPVKERCPDARRTVAAVMVHVVESGQVEEVRVYGPSGCAPVDSTAEAAAHALTFTPAQREGQPQRSWVRLMFRAER